MRLILAGALAASLALATVATAQAQAPTQLPNDKICNLDGPVKNGFCKLVVVSTVVFAVLDWVAPLNQPDADPLRCRGYGSVIRIPIPANQCAPLE